MDPGFGPDEWLGVLVVGFDEGIDVLAELGDGSERGAVQRLSLQDREPDFGCRTRSASSTERSRRHRRRRRRGTRRIMVEVNDEELAALVARGYLPAEMRSEKTAIGKAVEGVISDMAFDLQREATL